MKRPVLALLSLLSLSHLVGCADDTASGTGLTFDACAPLDIGLVAAPTGVQAQGVTDALSMWNQAAATALVSTTVADPIASTGEVPTPISTAQVSTAMPRVPLVFQVAAPPFHGLYDNQAGQIFINQDLSTVDPLRITIAHEIGHAFGLVHISPDVRPSLMNPGNTTVGITPDDVAALAAIWGRCAQARMLEIDAGN